MYRNCIPCLQDTCSALRVSLPYVRHKRPHLAALSLVARTAIILLFSCGVARKRSSHKKRNIKVDIMFQKGSNSLGMASGNNPQIRLLAIRRIKIVLDLSTAQYFRLKIALICRSWHLEPKINTGYIALFPFLAFVDFYVNPGVERILLLLLFFFYLYV
jgi:hypothetical protein